MARNCSDVSDCRDLKRFGKILPLPQGLRAGKAEVLLLRLKMRTLLELSLAPEVFDVMESSQWCRGHHRSFVERLCRWRYRSW